MSSGVPSTDLLVELTNDCRTREEYEVARLEWLENAIGFDASYVGAALPENTCAEPVVSGVSPRYIAHCEAQSDRYWQDRLTLNHAALRGGGAVFDQEAVPAAKRDRMPFYSEIVAGLGIRAIAVSVLRTQGKIIGCLYLGRVSRGARFGGLTAARSQSQILPGWFRRHCLQHVTIPPLAGREGRRDREFDERGARVPRRYLGRTVPRTFGL